MSFVIYSGSVREYQSCFTPPGFHPSKHERGHPHLSQCKRATSHQKTVSRPIVPSHWTVKLTNTGDILQLAKQVHQTSSWPACQLPWNLQIREEMISGSSQSWFLFLFYYYFLNQGDTALSTNADRSSLQRLAQTERPSDLVWGYLWVNDRWLRTSASEPAEREISRPHLFCVCKLHCIISGTNIEFKWLSCFDSLIIQMKGLAEKKDSVPNSCLWIILFLHFLPVSHLWIILVWKPIIIEFHMTKSL